MGLFGRLLGRERRSAFTQQIVNTWQTHAEAGGDRADPATLGVISACSRIWSDALADCAVSGPAAVNRNFLAVVGADLIRRGHSRWLISTSGGNLMLERPSIAQRTSGGWILTWNRDPGESITEQVLPGQVLNLLWEHSGFDTWTGIPPWQGVTGNAAAEMDSQLADRAAGPAGYLLALSESEDTSSVDRGRQAGTEVSGQLADNTGGPRLGGANRGRMAIVQLASPYDLKGESGSIRPAAVGFDPTEGTTRLADRCTRELAGACGVPVALVTGEGGGASQREAQRVFQARLQHRADRIADSLSRQLDAEISLDASRVFRIDITMRARSCKSLVEAGMSVDHAARLCGLEPEPVTAMPDGMDSALL